MVVGIAAALIGIIGDHSEGHQHTWAALFVNGFFFFGIALGTLYFFALQYATESAWSVMVKRVYEAVMSFLPVGAIILLVVLLAGSLGIHHLWHWMDVNVRVPNEADPHAFDPAIAEKSAFLNPVFFWVRTIVYLATFILFARWFRRQSLEMDQRNGEQLVASHLKNYRRGALFLVFFAVFSSMMSWDWIMSIDAHWFSTLFGWYVFSGMWVSAMITALVLVLYLKRKGYLPQVNNSHIHDMGKWVFAISFLWSYLWFSQFMLIWYSDIPEEVIYFQVRINEHPWLLWGMFFINFAVPMVLLMSRDAKRNPRFLITVATIIFIGHWLDVVQMVMPSALGEHFHGIGALEVGLLAAFLGLFIFVVLNTLTKAPLTPVHHPYLDESIHHHT
ncbi:MAG: quinol:cytochrome C oxidoreductase [Flavobacteriales bacterium]|nr:quinol:cytochrome C oxidoreductase [Flavobacteriales bacterium]MCB9166812.1 quinol:cytochrome C oxidoreductase [Flavobacteriales bacterium]